MKTIFETSVREELITRINALNENSKAQWGKMNVYQMLKHCRLWSEMILGRKKYKQAFIGRLFGKALLKNAVKDDSPMKRSTPTVPEFIIKENGNMHEEKKKWIALIEEHANFLNDDFVHPFFGKMNKEQIGIHAYKHCDHHLRQFKC
ncbi:MAG: DUF1569 domain-containing protein [Bacteroidota bacterium]